MISNRLKSLTKYVDKEDNIIDVGCDHALLDIYLILNTNIKKLIVSDITLHALNQGIDNIKKYKLENNIETRLGNGLEVLNDNDKVDTIIISGMGTHTILDILNDKYINKIKKLIIQSNNDYELLRREIIKLGFKISAEEVIIDKEKLYINIMFEKGYEKYTDIDFRYGTNKLINRNLYYDHLLNKCNKIINNINDLEKKENILKEIEIINKLKVM